MIDEEKKYIFYIKYLEKHKTKESQDKSQGSKN